ncbi:hypothetical protein INS49_005471 [Diaporthe citri]|uniref:uncharacterized protein n=1 Tax=Diaporthe citri TaxID=83186 RepID=UPI001C81DC6D|nr:uncharacterized protein INS49_005471 [Diaporthe citri]KAG6353510.1 hypothetical protein INS49_005471 [Diaporthe citri]
MASYPPSACCTVGCRHQGTPKGSNIRVAGKYDAYLAEPAPEKSHKNAAILFLSDIMGVWQNSRLLADEFAAAGYLTLLVDLFYGDPVGCVAHPSFMGEDELARLGGPLSIAAAEVDHLFPDERRCKTEQILKTTKQPWLSDPKGGWDWMKQTSFSSTQEIIVQC